ncbi:PEP-CTERM sorting domain-containing protein [Nitrosomonas sp.]|uniref:PEP-CTERM sorting domain-containing protein n=1 Tax=Nitrosomonas sp. TaxID=42353 RepID=UPI00273119B6|nr:PEP-CTERM sorting domain-containing protein [Nitrosomonas sp.]MDP2225081.1 HAF repeat-containing protein [Nitrosomonas sp.]
MMNKKLSKIRCIAIFLSTISATLISTMAHADWSIIDLSSTNSVAWGINDSGQVVGSFTSASGYTHAFITGPNGIGMTDLGTLLGAAGSVARGINDSGQVVGMSGNNHPFITGPNGMGMTDLGNLGGSYSSANGINDSGQVVGWSGIIGDSHSHAFITGPNGMGMADLGTLYPNRNSNAAAINDSGQVVGSATTDHYYSHAFITGPNGIGMTDLGTLGGTTSFAKDINDSGQVVGGADAISFSHEYSHAFITGPNGMGMTDLGTLGGKYSFANGINDSGEVVGLAYTIGDSGLDNFHSFIFSHGGMTDLNVLDAVVAAGWSHLYVTDINNHGQIVGYGVHNGFSDKAFLLTYTQNTIFTPSPIFIPPVPEQETYAMLLAGLGLMGFVARRKKVSAI